MKPPAERPEARARGKVLKVIATAEEAPAVAPAGPGRRRGFYEAWGKRPLDILCAAGLMVLLSPLFVAILLCLTISGGAPIFAHPRIGRDGIAFRCYKFRSMCRDSHAVLRRHLAADRAAAEEWAAARKLRDDPRVTALGRFLRKTSLDELPQLFNVLRGDMSMVGPRPVTREELVRYGPYLPDYLSVRPGLTGPWQVHGRGRTTYPERVAMDAAYVRNMSLAGDLSLMLQTAATVVRGSGS